MKKGVLVLVFLLSIFLTGCFESGGKKYVCTMNIESNIKKKIVATLDSNNKVSSIDFLDEFETEEEAKNNYADYQVLYKDNVELDGKTIIVKKVETSSEFARNLYGDFIGLTKEELKEQLSIYTCE